MNAKIITVLLIFIVISSLAFASENPMLVRVDLPAEDGISQLCRLHFDIPYTTDSFADVVVYPKDLQKLQESGLTYQIIHEDLVKFYQSRNPLSLDMGGFPTFTEVIDIIDSLHNNYPSIVSAKWSIGTSWELRDLWVFKISDNVDVDEDEPEVFYNALIHAREPASMSWLLYFAGWLCENYGNDSVATDIVDNRELFFLPVFNPDGYVYNQQTNPDGGGTWRKNRRNNGGGVYGVDLNRNWGYMWGYDDIGSSPYPSSETYRGPSAFSEPETQAVRDFTYSRDFSFIINAHTYGGYLLYPWGYADIYTPDHDIFTAIGDSASALTGYSHGTPWELLYNTNGDANDWDYGEQTAKPMILCLAPETGDAGDGFWPSPSRIPVLNEQMLPLGIYIAQIAGSFEGIAFDYPDGIPEIVTPGQTTSFEVVVYGVRNGTPVPGSGQLHYSIDSAPFVTQDMDEPLPNHYEAILPAINCGSTIEFYLSADEESNGTFNDPKDAPAETYSAFPATDSVIVFNDNFETDQGWTVVNACADGEWERGIPVGGGDRGDPPTDYDGSGQCYLTDNVDGNSDVDDGYTYLISPTFDLSGGNGIIYYALWYTNYAGNAPNNDLFKTYVSNNNGANWVLAETIGPETSSGWVEHSINVEDFVIPTSQIKIRFEASDLNEGSIVEAGIDAVSVITYECNQTQGGTIAGTVTDTSGPITGVDVFADDGLGNTGSDITTEDGTYSIDVPASTYDVSFSHANYRDTTITDVVVTEGNTTTVDVVMEEIQPIPTLSEWGMIILALLLLAAGTVAVIRKRTTVNVKTN